MGVRLSQLATSGGASFVTGDPPAQGPVQYVNIPVAGDRVQPCIQCGLLLVEDGDDRCAIFIRAASKLDFRGGGVSIEVMAREHSDAEAILAELRRAMRDRNVYRGSAISLAVDGYRELAVRFHRLPRVSRDEIILPPGVLERIEQQTIGFAHHRNELLAAGRHLKRGLLLYGPPGTGKTLTAKYLAAQMPDRTTLILTGRTQGLIEQSCRMARLLEPSMVILEDVDLVAEERTGGGRGCTPLLFELLNEMDGLAEDADVIFLLTTNRADLLEPALASRPGRIDLAVEVPLPDRDCRVRLLDLYGRGLELPSEAEPRLADKTDGVSAAFIRELLRKASLFAADDGDAIRVKDEHLDHALHELAVEGGELLHRLLGGRPKP